MSAEQRALELLGQNFPQHVVATACGISESRISQLMADPQFASRVSELRMLSLQKVAEIDQKYDTMEEKLLDKLEKQLPMVVRPMETARILQTVNAAKRRASNGIPDPSGAANGRGVVNITLPNIVVQKFITNVNNQVVEVRDDSGQAKSLVTATSQRLTALTEDRKAARSQEVAIEHDRKDAPTGLRQGSGSQAPVTAEDL